VPQTLKWRRERWFAQHGEDRRLAKLLAGRRRGFYVDVGAWDPHQDSVTKYFYERNWRGVNVEPHPVLYQRLVAARPKDVNLPVALGATNEERLLTLVGNSGLTTFDQHFAGNAERWLAENGRGQPEVAQIRVQVTTLAEVCRRYVPAGTSIDFLKIDVEGAEGDVLRGGDWANYRPEILVVEAVQPLTSIPAWDDWDDFVRSCGYAFIEFDGLNRWYRRER
jgi:FkbM family methyltransferase